ncbi:MAG TPA: c-type cytochrome [Novosphingobium sp.]|nr:c-type cytochrome [Novosphingobium sp.]
MKQALFLAVIAVAMTGAAAAAPAAMAQPARPQAFAKCQACHVAAPGAKSTIGPNLFDVVGRKAGSLPGFTYSPAMKAAGFAWTPQRLDAFLKAPMRDLPGTRMPFAGLSDAGERAAIVAYLKGLGK